MLYCQVNVYRGRGRWVIAGMLKEPGRPFPRTAARLFTRADAIDPALPFHEALEAAADALYAMAAEARRSPEPEGLPPGAPGGGGGDTP